MNPLIPLLVVIPLAGAFLIMIIGRFIRDFNKYFTSLILLILAVISFYFLFTTGEKIFVYKVGGWEPVDKVPIGIYMVMDGFTSNCCLHNKSDWFLVSILFNILY